MLISTKGRLLVSLINGFSNVHFQPAACISLSAQSYAARKGTRERKRKAKVKVEVEKVGFIPHSQRNREKFLQSRPQRKFDDSYKPLPVDNVFVNKYYRWTVYPFAEAVHCHRETHHPDIYNKPNAPLHVMVELNMEGERKTRFVDNFTRIAPMPHPFDHGEERTTIAFAKDPEMQEAARQAGASLAGGVELIKEVQNGAISLPDFQFIIAHPDILAELVALRGLMKKKFPSPKSGTLNTDLPAVVTRFVHGISYSAVKDEYEKDFGSVETVIGTLNMEAQHLEENFASLIQDIYKMKPKRSGTFISRCLLGSPPSREKLKVDYAQYVGKEKVESDDEEPEEAENAAAS